eukprot:GEMP01054178.1.p1 GENE.GEMP01054178.1~~GEMP01054178.1.p1  ORF type:complete len:433 (+),score=81.12 GEMP01054178.1:132-1430(+)
MITSEQLSETTSIASVTRVLANPSNVNEQTNCPSDRPVKIKRASNLTLELESEKENYLGDHSVASKDILGPTAFAELTVKHGFLHVQDDQELHERSLRKFTSAPDTLQMAVAYARAYANPASSTVSTDYDVDPVLMPSQAIQSPLSDRSFTMAYEPLEEVCESTEIHEADEEDELPLPKSVNLKTNSQFNNHKTHSQLTNNNRNNQGPAAKRKANKNKNRGGRVQFSDGQHGSMYSADASQVPQKTEWWCKKPASGVSKLPSVNETAHDEALHSNQNGQKQDNNQGRRDSRPWDRPMGSKLLCTFLIGIPEDPQFCVSRRIIGRGGENMRFISDLCRQSCEHDFKAHGPEGEVPTAKIRLRGKGSGFKERDTKKEATVPLQVNVSTSSRDAYETAKREITYLLTSIYRDYVRMYGIEFHVKLFEHPQNPPPE